MRNRTFHRGAFLALAASLPLLGGCAGGMDRVFSSDLLSKDADWFSRPQRLFIKNVSIETPPLTPDKQVGPEDLIGADGACPGMAPPEANALADGTAAPLPIRQGGTVALGHTECDVTRGIGAPDSVNLSTAPNGGRMAVVIWSRGPRAGIYTFTGGRLSMIERGPEPVASPKPVRAKPKKRATG